MHPKAKVGDSAMIWNWVQVREDAEIGEETIISKGVYVDFGVKIGKNVKIQNNVSVYHGVTIEDGVFVGPHVCFTNDKRPRAINPDGSLKSAADWEVSPILHPHGRFPRCQLHDPARGDGRPIRHGRLGRRGDPGRAGLRHRCRQSRPASIGWVCECGDKLDEKHHCARCNRTVAASGHQRET